MLLHKALTAHNGLTGGHCKNYILEFNLYQCIVSFKMPTAQCYEKYDFGSFQKFILLVKKSLIFFPLVIDFFPGCQKTIDSNLTCHRFFSTVDFFPDSLTDLEEST